VSAINLNAGETKSVLLEIAIPVELIKDKDVVFVGNVIFKVNGNIEKEATLVINPRSGALLFDAAVSIPRAYKLIRAGKDLIAQVKLLQVGLLKDKVDVTASYVIKDLSGNRYLEQTETFYVLGDKDISKQFETEALKPGKYVLGLTIAYEGGFATSSDEFEIKPGLFSWVVWVLLITIVVVALLLVVIGLKRYIRYYKLGHGELVSPPK